MAWTARTTFWLVASLAITVALSMVLWFALDVPVFFGFLFLPFLFIAGRKGRAEPVRGCPRCDFATRDPELRFCPRHGDPLEQDHTRVP